MNAKSNLSLAISVVAVVAAGMAWRANHHAQRAQTAAATAVGERTRIDADAQRAADRIAQGEKRVAELQAALNALRAGQAAPVARRTPTQPAPGPALRRFDPLAQAAELKRYKAGLLLSYGSFYRKMGFTPDQIARFEELLSDQQGRRNDLSATVATGGLTSSDPAIAALRRENTGRFKAEQIELLGEAGYAQFQEYNRGADRRFLVQALVKDLALSPTPLSSAQARQLGDILSEVGFKENPGANREQWEAILARAPGFLSSAQLAELRAQPAKSQFANTMDELSRLIDQAKKQP